MAWRIAQIEIELTNSISIVVQNNILAYIYKISIMLQQT